MKELSRLQKNSNSAAAQLKSQIEAQVYAALPIVKQLYNDLEAHLKQAKPLTSSALEQLLKMGGRIGAT